MPVDFSVTNQLASPAIYASSFATRPAASFKGRLFVDTNVPSTGIYRDTGTAWVAIAGSAAEVQDLNSVCTVGNSTTTLGIVIAGDSAIAASPEEGFALTVGVSGLSITTGADCRINELTIGRGGSNLVENTTIGYQALNNNTVDGLNNTAIGYRALYLNSEASNNTAIGHTSLYTNTEGSNNTAIGRQALYSNIEGSSNTSVGYLSLNVCTSGTNNVALGVEALDNLTEGNNNIGIGHNAGNVVDGVRNIFIGVNTALTDTADNENVVIGYGALAPSGNNQFVVGSAAHNAGAVSGYSIVPIECHRTWDVVINGVARKILLKD